MPGKRKVTEIIFGAPLDPFSKETRRHVVLVAFLAWIGLWFRVRRLSSTIC
jgi:hypothetical protein